MRVCSGKFARDMTVVHAQTGKTVRLSSSHKLFGQERETVDEAWPGDVIGLVGHDAFGIGDTLTEDRSILFDEIPRFPAGGLRLHLEPQPVRLQEIQGGPGAAAAGGRRPVVHGPLGAARARPSWPPSARCSSRSCSTA